MGMNTNGRGGKNHRTGRTEQRGFRRAPIAHALALVLATGGAMGQAHAVQPFSAAWFANKGAIQATVAATGLMPNGTPVSSLSPQAQQQQANTQLQQSIANLGQAARGIAWLQGMQASQRQTALGNPSNIPDGLGAGGLDTGSLAASWTNASAPTQSTDANGKTVVDIQQTADKAIANWQTFNVGKNTIVQFDQASSDWAILNRITDPAMAPSTIEGQIRAPGTVLIVNQNGIVFSGSSQVNTRNLVAAAAGITDSQFTTNGIYSAQASGAYVPSFTNATGALVVEAGAQINTAASTTATQSGGYVLLLGASVTNAGSVTTPGGQAELAAGDFFIVRPGQSTTTNQYSTTHGNEIAPQFNTGSTAGNVTNSGLLMATEGDITLAGHTVVQDGVAVATTSVNTRGTIHLLTSASDATSSVTTTANGLNAIVLDDSGDTALDSQRDAMITASATEDAARRVAAQGVFDNLSTQDDREDESRVEIVSGGNVNFDSGSTTLATGGQIAVSAGNTTGRTTVSNGAILDVSGAVGVNVAMASNNIQVNVQGNEQRDDPLNRDTTDLNSSNVWIDKNDLIFVPAGTGGDTSDRWYTAGGLLEVSGYLGLAGHSIGEWAAQGGSIAFTGGAVVTQSGSNINLSGGSLNVQTGFMQQTWLTGADGQLYNVDDAPGDIVYTGIYKGFEVAHARWGADAAEFFYNPLIAPKERLENGYTTGRDAGQLIVATDSAVLEGDIDTATYQGPLQTQKENTALDGYNQSQNAAAQGAQLILGSYTSAQNTNAANGPVEVFYNLTPTFNTIVFGDDADIGDTLTGAALPADRIGTATINSDRLNDIGFGSIITAANDSVTVNDALTVTPGGTIELLAPQVTINANLTARSGSIVLGNIVDSVALSGAQVEASLPAGNGDVAEVTVSQGVTLDARGLWSNLQLSPDDSSGLPYIDGGAVNIRSTGAVTLATGTLVDVSSGAALMRDGSLNGGMGGDVTLAAGYVAGLGGQPQDAPLLLDGELRAYGVAGGGTLTIESGSAIGIGADLLTDNGTLHAGETAQVNLHLAEDIQLAAGDKIPFDFSLTVSVLLPGQTAPGTAQQGATTLGELLPSISQAHPLTLAADWTIPTGTGTVVTGPGGNPVPAGSTLPAGTVIFFMQSIPPGYVVPGDVFPNGIPVVPVTNQYVAGTVLTAPLTMPAGTVIAAGDTFSRDVAVRPTVTLNTALFQTGFSSYAVKGNDGVAVADGTTLDVVMPVYRWSDATPGAATGVDPAQALQLWTPPVYMEDAAKGQLTQRGGASLALAAGSVLDGDTPLYVGTGAVITVDPGQSIALHSNNGQLTVEGRLNAWGGDISLDDAVDDSNSLHISASRSIWIGENAVLDAASRAYVAVDDQGRAYGVAPDGGSIEIGAGGAVGDSFLVIRPGALLDASGSAADIDLAAGHGAGAPSQPLMLAGDGGSIELHAINGLYLDGTMRAFAGGPGAAGGSLTVDMASRVYSTFTETPTAAFEVMHNLTLTQDTRPSTLAADLAPGQADPSLQVGNTVLSVEQVQDGGFDALTLSTKDLFVFDGNIDLSLGRSLNLQQGIFSMSAATPAAQVHLAAPYIRLDGGSWVGTQETYTPGLVLSNLQETHVSDGSALILSADLIDLYGQLLSGAAGQQGNGDIAGPNGTSVPGLSQALDIPAFAVVSLDSTGDVRFNNSSLTSGGDILVDAAQLYPMSGKSGALTAGLLMTTVNGHNIIGVNPDSVLQIRSNGQAAPVPDSVFGQLTLIGGTVDQGGVVQAPLGTISINDSGSVFSQPVVGDNVILRSGSLTSVSADGLVMPFGGTVDGLTYQGTDGAGNTDTTLYNLGATMINRPNGNISGGNVNGVLPQGITIGGTSIIGEAGAVLDLSGGGDLRGAGFISGRGGSVNVLTTPLVNANPVLNNFSKAGDQVYAIVPGRASDYAPVIADKGAGDPAIGRQMEIGANVPGLPAGTYTLLPASYALMPGAWRVELGSAIAATSATAAASTVALPGGSWLASGTLMTANTTVRDALPTQLILSPAATVRDDSQFNEMSYADFAISQAGLFGNLRPRLPEDGKILRLDFTQEDGVTALQFDGVAKMSGVGDGASGELIVSGNTGIEITGAGAVPTPGSISLEANALNAFHAGAMFIGGELLYFNGLDSSGDSARLYFSQTGNLGASVHVLDGADLQAGQIFLLGQDVTVDGGATLDTRSFGAPPIDSDMGFIYANSLRLNQTGDTPAVLAVANGRLDFIAAEGGGQISVADGANLLTEGTIAFVSPGGLNLGNVNLGARYLTVSQDQVDIGNADALAAARTAGVLPAGWQLTQDVLDRLLRPSDSAGVPALEQLSLTAGGAFNFFGSVTLDTGSSAAQLVFNTPAFYGWGTDSDVVRLVTGTLVWNGVSSGAGTTGSPFVSVAPTAVRAGGPGTGLGQLVIDADTVEFGYDAMSRAQTQTALDRVALGFGAIEIDATDSITANSKGTLSVGQSRDVNGVLQGGALTMNTPLLTGVAGSVMSYITSGALQVNAIAGAAPGDTAAVSDLGATVTLQGSSVVLDTAVALPSGQLTIAADGDIALGANSRIDLAGRGAAFFDVIKYSWGGDLVMGSTHGDIAQAAGSLIDVSALHNVAGSISAVADDPGHGNVSFDGALAGAASDGYEDGQISLRAQSLGDFAALNEKLNGAGFFGARNFDIQSGDLVIGDEVKAHSVSISVDGGSLTVNGDIDASGAQVGTIRLGARDNLTLAATATLDAHGTVLQTDSDGAAIDASNTADVELTTSSGRIVLADGSTVDLRAADGVARGKLSINAPRLGGAGGIGVDGSGNGADDVAVDAPHGVNILGAASIAINAFRTYQPTDGIIDQAYLDGIDGDSTAFIDAAWGNGVLQGRLAGLTSYGAAYHLRPGAEIESSGDLTVSGDLDLSGYRYGPNADPSVRGSGEPGVLLIRAGGDLTIHGSINDGFTAQGTPDDNGWIVMQAGLQTSDTTLTQGIVLGQGSTFPAGSVLGFALPIVGSDQLTAGAPATKSFTLSQDVTLPAGWVLGAAFSLPSVFAAGTTLPDTLTTLSQPLTLQADWFIAPGSPEGNYFDSLQGVDIIDPSGNQVIVFSGTTILRGSSLPANDPFAGLPKGFVIPANVFPDGIPGGMKINPAGTKLTTPFTVTAGTQIPVGFTLPDTVVTQTGATLKANTVIPQQVTLGDAIVVAAAFQTTGIIVTPTHTYAAGDTVAAGTTLPYGTTIDAGNSLPFEAPVTSMLWAPGQALVFTGNVTTANDISLATGSVLPQGTDALGSGGTSAAITRAGQNWAAAPMLAPGMQSWSITLVAGADLTSADTHALQSVAALAGSGNITLDDPHYMLPQLNVALPSVIRTGTGDLTILAGGDYTQQSLFGVYTAGTAIDAGDSAPFNVARALASDGTLLGAPFSAYEATLNSQRMWFTEQGGNLTLSAQGNILGYQDDHSESIGDWLWRQGGDGLGQQTAWGINFGSYVMENIDPASYQVRLASFTGIGTLGGGNVVINAGGNIGGAAGDPTSGSGSSDIVAAVGGSGRVVNGAVLQTGGGDLSVTAGGSVNGGMFVDLRGDTTVNAASVGLVTPTSYGTRVDDPRPLDPNTPYAGLSTGGVRFAPGDGSVVVNTLGDLVLGALVDPGRVGLSSETAGAVGTDVGAAATWFTLWTSGTTIDAFSAGGNASALGDSVTAVIPAVLRLTAAAGSIYVSAVDDSFMMPSPTGQLELLARGMVSGDAANNQSNIGTAFGPLGTSLASIATPLNPAWRLGSLDTTTVDGARITLDSNYWGDAAAPLDGILPYSYGLSGGNYLGAGGTLFMFGPNTVTDNSAAGDGTPTRIYAVTGDVLGIRLGEAALVGQSTSAPATYYYASKPVRILAGGDIVSTTGLIVQDAATDVSMIAAEGSLIYTDVSIAGPGTLELSAGKQVYQSDRANLVSLGAIETGDSRPGADIAVQAGIGAGAPGTGASNIAGFAALYLDPANLADPSMPLADQPGKVVKTYDAELLAWLQQRYGFSGTAAQALAYFDGLAPEQQRVFVRQVYYAELTAGGREFNDPDSQRFGSYLRGRDAIATLFPVLDAAGATIEREGDITLSQGTSTNAGIRTIAGGAIQTLTPGGSTVIGVEGVAPATLPGVSPAGLITQGAGDIQMYSEGSILLGLSRVMTTFGGDILGWSAQGDINAGRGAKTTIVFTPPKREYDEIGDVTLSPDVPSTGAGIATLAPIPEVPAGDVDLIAPLGTIDAGEAGIRVSGNVNLAALQVVNAANIEVKGKSTGLPLVATVNVGALTNASAAASQAALAAQDVVQRDRNAARQALPSIFTVRVLGFGNDPAGGGEAAPQPSGASDRQSSVGVPYNAASPLTFVGIGDDFDSGEMGQLSDTQRRHVQQTR
jgi:filamentous hemagglutinin family protein